MLSAGIGGAILHFGTCYDAPSIMAEMTDAMRHDLDTACTTRRTIARVSRQRVASWTGRSAVSSATDTTFSRLATAGARKTRVSEMRDATARAGRRALQGSSVVTGAGTSPLRR